MDYTEAVRLARTGNERGFGYLYEHTYKSKYYLALQYMKQKEAAEDVLQDAYLKAFSKLDTLEDPERFPAWLGQIVANTAKNALAKNNPLLFTEVEAQTELEDFVEQIEDEDITSQPELSYTREETRELVQELINALSEEQRLCVLLFHIEGIPIKEIAQTLGCSENTVKSRLNYGRKNLRIKAEELQKKGYKLYSIAPLPLLLLLLRTDWDFMLAEGSIQSAGHILADKIFLQIPALHQASGASGEAFKATQTGAGKAGVAKAGFLHTIAGKITTVVLSICLVGGVIYGVTQIAGNKDVAEESAQESRTEQESEQEDKTEEPAKAVVVDDESYQELLEGNLTKGELEFVLAYGPETLTEQGLSESDYLKILNCWCQASEASGELITFVGNDANYRKGYSVDDINRYLSSFTDYRFTEDNDSDTPYGNDVSGSTIWITPAELSFEAEAEITDVTYIEDTMKVHFTYEKNSYENGLTTTQKTATLKKNANGKFQIVTIEEGTIPLEGMSEETQTPDKAGTSGNIDSIQSVYEGVLASVQKQEVGYEFPNAGGSTDFQYFLWDMNGDGIKELVVGAMFTEDVFEVYDIKVFTVTHGNSGYALKEMSGDIVSLGLYLPADGKGLYSMDMSRGTGETDIYRITIEGDALIKGSSPELTYTMGDSTETQFINSNHYSEWMNISNLDGLKELN